MYHHIWDYKIVTLLQLKQMNLSLKAMERANFQENNVKKLQKLVIFADYFFFKVVKICR
jgi:hypothetical protein